MTRVDPSAGTAKWVSRLSGATQEIQAGVQNVTTAPGQAAAAKADKWLNNVTASQSKFKNNVAAVSLQSWQQSFINIGIPRIAQGAQQKQGKYEAFAQQFYPFLDRGVAQVKAMDDTTFEARVQRAVAMMRYNKTFQRRPTG